mgnify:CR=1 FL=1
MYRNTFGAVFSKRAAISFFVIMILFFTCILRVAAVALTDYSAVLKKQSSLRLSAGTLRGTVYDRNMVPLTNTEFEIVAAVSPTPRAVTAISGILEGEELERVLERLKSGKPALCVLPREVECDGIAVTKVYRRNTAGTPAVHLVGYTDSDGHGVSGIERAYDDSLYSDSKVSFVYTTDGAGCLLYGIAPEIENDSSVTASGVVSTIDVNIQNAAEKAAKDIEYGAVIVADAKSGKILAAVSRPDFDCSKVADYLGNDGSPLLNRALAAYNVGSVFKPCVAAAGIENGYGDFTHNCTGSSFIVDRVFKCHKRSGHGFMTLKSGLANSCNTFFYNYAIKIGGDKIYNTASALGFGKSLKVCDGLYTAAGSLPERESLSNTAFLANFSIGQGRLSVSPISMLTLYCAIASDGAYYIPSAVEGTVSGGSFKEYDRGSRTRVMSAETADTLKKYLAAVIDEGTGTEARPETVTAAGKTATAQTGKFENGREICEGWFCGFFPAENPKYTVIVFSENTAKQTASCGKIFSGLADRITSFNFE